VTPRQTGPRSQRGLPTLAEPNSEAVSVVLEMAAQGSKPFGTTVEVRDGVGMVRVA
jgi:hypothetical protein